MKQFEVSLLIIANQTILSQNQNGLVDTKIKILRLKCHYGVLWEWQYEMSHAPVSHYLLGSSGGLPVPWDTLVSIREIPSPLQLYAAAIRSNDVWQGCLALKGNETASCFLTKMKANGKDRCRDKVDSHRHVKMLPVKIFRAGVLHTLPLRSEFAAKYWPH